MSRSIQSSPSPRLAIAAATFAAALVVATPAGAHAQGFGDRLKHAAAEAAKRQTEEHVEHTTEDATDATLDGAEASAKKGAKAAAKGAKGDTKGKGANDTKGASSTSGTSGASGAGGAAGDAQADQGGASQPSDTRGAFVNFDFVPGTRVLFAEDFSRDNVGDFPRHLELKEGNGEVATLDGQRWLRTGKDDALVFAIPLPETLPARFTFEAEVRGFNRNALEVWFEPLDGNFRPHAMFNAWDAGLTDEGELKVLTHNPIGENAEGATAIVRLMADGQHVKAYVNGVRVANAPQVTLSRTRKLWIKLAGADDQAVLLGNVRVAAGGKALYDALATDGRVATQGIYFATASDVPRPESKPTLDEIAAMLKEHADLRLRIEGHTDDVGNAAANQALSEKRAAAVKAALVQRYGIAASRLESQGFGASKPAASNATGEGRQQNRRVELVKL